MDAMKLLSRDTTVHFHDMYGFVSPRSDVVEYSIVGGEDEPFPLKRFEAVGRASICSICEYYVSYKCATCRRLFCQVCVSWKVEPCGGYSCGNHDDVKPCGSDAHVPHAHMSDRGVYCSCSRCVFGGEERYSDAGDEYDHDYDFTAAGLRHARRCPVADIVGVLLRKNAHESSLVISRYFNGTCGCTPSCGCEMPIVEFLGDDAGLQRAAVSHAFGLVEHEWLRKRGAWSFEEYTRRKSSCFRG
jgi:hypothetical protein